MECMGMLRGQQLRQQGGGRLAVARRRGRPELESLMLRSL